jgi:predicted  nucleic acid-binding Zn-ribbon protein
VSNVSLANSLRRLIDVEKSLHAAKTAVLTDQQKVEDLKEELSRVCHSQQTANIVVHTAQKAVDRLELEAKTVQTKEATKKKQLEAATKKSVCEGLKRELALINQTQEQLENELVQAWHLLDEAHKTTVATRTTTEDAVKSCEQKLKEAQERLNENEKQLMHYNAQRNEQIANLPAELQERYTSMHARTANPLVRVIRGMCSACFYQIIPRDITRLHKNELVECRSCYRLLYLDADSGEDQSVDNR